MPEICLHGNNEITNKIEFLSPLAEILISNKYVFIELISTENKLIYNGIANTASTIR